MKKQEASVWVREGLTVLAESGPDGQVVEARMFQDTAAVRDLLKEAEPQAS